MLCCAIVACSTSGGDKPFEPYLQIHPESLTFDAKGVATADTTAEIKTKLELGDDYNMAKFGTKHDGSEGAVLEWNVQAAEFDKALVGKTAADFAAFADETGYATGDLATAGCTINVADMIKAATKAVA